MSIQSRMQKVDIYNSADGYDSFGRPVKNGSEYEDVPCMTIDMCITVQTLQSSNKAVSSDIRYADITHFGITACKDLERGQLVISDGHKYKIHLTPNTCGRLSQIYLKEVIDDE